ncbi:LLM class flavin-dependent oxidoreductase [Halobacteriales archaeon QS_5_70_15]|nr:MAG: LLM class flavin-dependent oxidoreductase [Halobacteriales archaeon QS_5_70_15]
MTDAVPGLLLPDTGGEPVEMGLRAEELGYEAAWMGELWGTSSVVALTELAVRTDRIGLGTAIVNVFSRTPAVLAMTAATLDRTAEGRFKLGVGTSTEKAVEDLHGMDWSDPNPVRGAHETIELTKQFLGDGGRVEYDGHVFEVADFPSLDADVPVYHAALGKANRRVVARLADGWMPHNVPFPDLAESFEYVAEHAREAGRDPDDISVAPYVPAAVDDDAAEARDAVRGHLAYYVGSGRGYERAVATRFPDEASEIAAHWRGDGRERDRAAAKGAVTDEMVEALGVAGTPETAREQLRKLLRMEIMDEPLVAIPQNASKEMVDRTVEELSPERL